MIPVWKQIYDFYRDECIKGKGAKSYSKIQDFVEAVLGKDYIEILVGGKQNATINRIYNGETKATTVEVFAKKLIEDHATYCNSICRKTIFEHWKALLSASIKRNIKEKIGSNIVEKLDVNIEIEKFIKDNLMKMLEDENGEEKVMTAISLIASTYYYWWDNRIENSIKEEMVIENLKEVIFPDLQNDPEWNEKVEKIRKREEKKALELLNKPENSLTDDDIREIETQIVYNDAVSNEVKGWAEYILYNVCRHEDINTAKKMLKASYNHGCDRAKEEWKRYQEHALFYSYEHSGDTSEGIYFINTENLYTKIIEDTAPLGWKKYLLKDDKEILSLADEARSIRYFLLDENEKKNFNGKSDIEAIWKRYAQLNSVQRFTTESVAKQNSMELLGVNINLVNVSILNDVPSKYYVGLANTTVSEDDALQSLVDPAHKMTIHDKEQLFRMANAAVKEGANFITFPEFFIPIVWLKDLTRFSQKNNVSIIAGLRYIRNANRAFNCTTIIQPCNNNGFVNTIALFREKNFYAPEEKDCLYKLGYRISNPERPLYYVICSNGIRYSTILCFEFTDIYSRASLKSKVDALFVPQLNKDTNYFSSIVESTSRDLHCLIVQANTSKYGDSRVTGPYDTIHKNVVQIKGGVNDVVIIGELEFEQIRNARQLYEANHKKTQFYCFDCKKVKKAKSPNFFKVCNNCPHQVKKQAIKDVPANFE